MKLYSVILKNPSDIKDSWPVDESSDSFIDEFLNDGTMQRSMYSKAKFDMFCTNLKLNNCDFVIGENAQ